MTNEHAERQNTEPVSKNLCKFVDNCAQQVHRYWIIASINSKSKEQYKMEARILLACYLHQSLVMDAKALTNESVFSFLHTLTMWHYPHLPAAATERRSCSNRSISPLLRSCLLLMAHAGTDRRTNTLSAYYALFAVSETLLLASVSVMFVFCVLYTWTLPLLLDNKTLLLGIYYRIQYVKVCS